MTAARDYLRLIRVRHYMKNLLVFAALGCSGRLFQADKLTAALAGFAAFCAASSVVYIINDIRDREKDRLHPTKRERPIASGRISPRRAGILAGGLLLAALLCNALVFHPLPSALLGAVGSAVNMTHSVKGTVMCGAFLLAAVLCWERLRPWKDAPSREEGAELTVRRFRDFVLAYGAAVLVTSLFIAFNH